jgi:Domain of unknown function (DUF3786)/Putative Fe-S cluster
MPAPQMPALKILGLTPKDNCRECGAPSCMAFAIEASQSARPLTDCPYIQDAEAQQRELVPALAPDPGDALAGEPAGPEGALQKAQAQIRELSLPDQAKRLGLPLHRSMIVVPVLGRRFFVDAQGGLHSESHVNPWLHLPILQYVIRAAGRPLSGDWVPYVKLPGAIDWKLFFAHRCEGDFGQLNVREPDLLADLLDLFGSTPPTGAVPPELLGADHLAFLQPLPGVALLFRRWLPEVDFDAKLSLLFDRASGTNLDAAALFFLTRGLVEMFTRFALRHGSGTS